MTEEGKFWAAQLAIVATLLVVTIIATVSYRVHQNNTILRMVEAGVGPLSAGCAVRHMDHALCTTHILSTGRQVKERNDDI